MRVVLANGTSVDLGKVEIMPTIGITDYSRRVTDDFGVTAVVPRKFSRRMSMRLAVPNARADEVYNQLVALRAKTATFIADDRYAWLQAEGRIKEFEFAYQTGDQTYYTLSIDGIAETEGVTDIGVDPSASGKPSAFKLVQPVSVTDAVLTSSSVAEGDAPAWSASSTYAKGATVTCAHRVYESLTDGNAGADPTADAAKWLDTGPTNRWAMFDEALGTSTIASAAVEVVLKAVNAISALALLDTNAASVRVRAPGYDRTVVPNGAGQAVFLDLAVAASASITVTVTPAAVNPGPQYWDDGAQWMDAGVWSDSLAAGDGTVTIGTFLFGELKGLGTTETGVTAGITDYSRKDTDEFGDVTIVERSWSKRMAAKTLIRSDAVDVVADRLAGVRARPSLWIARTNTDSLTIYGYPKDWSIEVGLNTSKLSLAVEGLSRAAPARTGGLGGPVDWTDLTDKTGTKPTNNADKTSENTSKDTNAVAGKPAGDVLAQIATAKAIFERLDADTIPAINQAIVDANTTIANARNDAAEAVDEVAELLAQARSDLTRADQILKERVDALVVEGGGYDDSGLRAAIERIDAALIVGDKAVAQQISAVKASSSGGMANRNPAFADLSARNGAVTTMMASRWGYWSSPPADASRQPGVVSEWAWLMRCEASQATGLSSFYFPGEAGYWVIDLGWELWDGGLSGAGLHLSLADQAGAEMATVFHSLTSLYNEPDQASAGTPFRFVRRTRLIKLEGNFRQIALVAALNFSLHGPMTAKQLAWHHIGLRRASDAEIKAGRASAELIPALDARVTREVTALADSDRALARDVAEVRAGYEEADRAMNGRVDETNTAFARADKVLADKQVVIEASARAVPTMLNGNAAFSDWPDGQYLPSLWSGSSSANSVSRVEGKVGRWAMRQEFGAGLGSINTFLGATGDASRWNFETPMVWDSRLNAPEGWYVLEADVELLSGQIVGSGLYLGGYDNAIVAQAEIDFDFSRELNLDGSEIGAGVLGRRYRFSKLVRLVGPAITFLRFHPLTALERLGRGYNPYKVLIWHLAGVRPANEAEIKAGKASGDIINLTARADSAVAALVDLEAKKATVQSVNTLRAEAGEAIGLVDDRVDVVAERERVTARSLETLSGQYGDTKLEVTRQAGIIGEKLGQNIAYFRTTVAAGSAIADMTAFADAATGVSAFRFKAGRFLFEGDVIIDGEITARKFNGASMAREARSTWSGSITPPAGQTINVPWSLSLPSIPPTGRFIYEYTFQLATNAGTTVNGGVDGRGRPITIHYVEDGGGLGLSARDAQGNTYAPRPNASDRVLATTDFSPIFTATVTMGTRNELEDGGDYVNRYVAATYTLTRIDLKVTWVAI